MKADTSEGFYQEFISKLRASYQSDKIQDGRFGSHTQVDLVNDGPTTFIIESSGKQKDELP
jgi:D-aminoacyl-tRNA deacylase